MIDAPKPTLADWLGMHRLDQDLCRLLLEKQACPEKDSCDTRSTQIESVPDGPALWRLVADILAADLAPLASWVDEVMRTARVNFEPDKERHPRPFTLFHTGRGHVYVSCPLTRQARDVITVSHEFGHALQLVCCYGKPIPPVQREICAFVAEAVVVRGLGGRGAALAEPAAMKHAAFTCRDLGADLRQLLKHLDRPETPYRYDWNYPIARGIVKSVFDVVRGPQFILPETLFTEETDLRDLALRIVSNEVKNPARL